MIIWNTSEFWETLYWEKNDSVGHNFTYYSEAFQRLDSGTVRQWKKNAPEMYLK